ncbi:unnamed protein product [Heligmosomoides polygyrus]|uniref:Amidase domain-containing protein n=1 Tax=Heligmosomoides polygyrus TaxID=6339 RepID=A0A3P8A5C1_HELPZ|nr:unnamed protein product [Heligmosomoides polygyrus]
MILRSRRDTHPSCCSPFPDEGEFDERAGRLPFSAENSAVSPRVPYVLGLIGVELSSETRGRKRGVLLIYSAYRRERFLLKPYLGKERTEPHKHDTSASMNLIGEKIEDQFSEQRFTEALQRGQMCVERAFQALQRQFLALHTELQYNPITATKISTLPFVYAISALPRASSRLMTEFPQPAILARPIERSVMGRNADWGRVTSALEAQGTISDLIVCAVGSPPPQMEDRDTTKENAAPEEIRDKVRALMGGEDSGLG